MTKSKTTKKALLSSVLALVLCFTMLLGTTFAWFTDTASTSVNTIQAGTLDIELLDENGTSLEGQTLSWQKAEGHENEAVLWEPGCTYKLQPITIKNSGNLALKYKVVIAGIDGSAKLNEVIDWTIKLGENTYSADDEMHLAATESATMTISGHMQESAGNEYQRETIEGVAITVYATQDTVEYDSTTNQYDKNATYDEAWDGTTSAVEKGNDGVYHISTAAQFAWVMKQSQNTGLASIYSGEKFVLDANIDFGGATITGFSNESVKFGGSFDGQGYTVSNFVINRSDREDYAGLFNYYSYGTIENLNVKNATVIGLSKVGALLGSIDDGATVKNCTVENCTVIADRKVGGVVGYAQGAAVNNITVKNTTVYCETSEQAYGKDQWGQVIGYKNTGYSESGNIAGDDVVVKTGVTYTAVSTAEALATAMRKGGNILLLNDISVENWTSVRVDTASAYTPIANSISIDGNGHSISGLTASLLGYNPAQYVEIKNLTIKNSNIVSNETGNSANCGAFAAYVDDSVLSFKMSNCHAVNVNVTANNSGAYGAGALVGYQGMTGQNGTATPVFSIVDCTVTGGSVKNTNGNAAGIVGMCYTNANSAVISGCSVSGVTITGEAANKQGDIVGTICNGGGALEIANCTYTGNAYGRTVGATVNVH